MQILKSLPQLLSLLIVLSILFSMGPSFSDFHYDSYIEFTAFYVNLTVLFSAGIFLKGKVNRRFIIYFGIAMILNNVIFYTWSDLFASNLYAKFWAMFVATLSWYLFFNHYNYIQCKALNFFERVGVNDALADKIVGPVGTTNLTIAINFYVVFWLVVDFMVAAYASLYGLSYGLAPRGSISAIFEQNNHINLFVMYDALIVVCNALVTILLAHRIVLDQKRPDSLGLGCNMTWDKSLSASS